MKKGVKKAYNALNRNLRVIIPLVILALTSVVVYLHYSIDQNWAIVGELSSSNSTTDDDIFLSLDGHTHITTNKMNSARIPNVIYQYGKPRTATTLQFHILCVMMTMLHADEPGNVGCKFNKIPKTKYQVIKSHELILLNGVPSGSWLFMTSENDSLSHVKNLESSRDIKRKNIVVPYVMDINLVLKRGHRIVYEYQKYFGLSNEQMENIADYFYYWDILRICCGIQMSKQWRKVLLLRGKLNQWSRNPKREAKHICDSYNMKLVEKFMMDSYIYKRYSQIPSLRKIIGRPSVDDGELNGAYCETCIRNVSVHQLAFNRKCV